MYLRAPNAEAIAAAVRALDGSTYQGRVISAKASDPDAQRATLDLDFLDDPKDAPVPEKKSKKHREEESKAQREMRAASALVSYRGDESERGMLEERVSVSKSAAAQDAELAQELEALSHLAAPTYLQLAPLDHSLLFEPWVPVRVYSYSMMPIPHVRTTVLPGTYGLGDGIDVSTLPKAEEAAQEDEEEVDLFANAEGTLGEVAPEHMPEDKNLPNANLSVPELVQVLQKVLTEADMGGLQRAMSATGDFRLFDVRLSEIKGPVPGSASQPSNLDCMRITANVALRGNLAVRNEWVSRARALLASLAKTSRSRLVLLFLPHQDDPTRGSLHVGVYKAGSSPASKSTMRQSSAYAKYAVWKRDAAALPSSGQLHAELNAVASVHVAAKEAYLNAEHELDLAMMQLKMGHPSSPFKASYYEEPDKIEEDDEEEDDDAIAEAVSELTSQEGDELQSAHLVEPKSEVQISADEHDIVRIKDAMRRHEALRRSLL